MTDDWLPDQSLRIPSKSFSQSGGIMMLQVQSLDYSTQPKDTIALHRTYIDMAAGDLAAGVLLSQLVYWYSPNEHGKRRLRIHKDGHWWIAKKRSDWWQECRLSPKQFDRASQLLERLGLIIIRNYRFDGSPVKHLSINTAGFNKALEFVIGHPKEVFTEAIVNKPEVVDNYPSGNMELPQKVISIFPKGKNPTSPKVDFHLPKRVKSLTYTTTEITTEIFSPLTPQGEKREEFEIDRSDSFSNTCTADPNIFTSVAEEKINRGNRSSAPVLTQSSTSDDRVNETSQCLPVRKYDPELGINPPPRQKTLQQRSRRDLAKASAFQWLPDGPWSIDGKLDPQFLDWQAKEWMKAYGGDLHKKKADVLRHFKKDAANVAIAWSNYSEQQIDRYRNAATRMEFGIGIKEDEQTQLLAHQRAITEPLPEEMNPVWSGANAEVLFLAGVEEAGDVRMGEEEVAIDTFERESCGSKISGSIDTAENQSCSSVDSRSIATSPSPEAEFASHPPKKAAVDIPVDADGLAENSDAYKKWQPKKMEGEEISVEEWKEKWSKLRERLSMSKAENF